MLSIFDDHIDISPSMNGGLLKRIVRKGDPTLPTPQIGDTVEIDWRIFLSDGRLAHSSRESGTMNETFSFVLGANPRQVIQGWEYALPTMLQGEVASLILRSELAFGEKGAPPLIPPSECLTCEIELLEVVPSVRRSYRTVGLNESIREELLEKVNSGESVISREVMENKVINETKSAEEIKFFDPKRHRVDPNERISGQGNGHSWEENSRSIDVTVPVRFGCRKADIRVDLNSSHVSVRYSDGSVVAEGPLHGRVKASESMWALLDDGPIARVQLSLEKSHGHQEIWTTVFDRGYLVRIYGPGNDDGI